MRSRIFRQIAQKFRRHTAVCQGISVQYDGKSASRLRAKPLGGLCAVLPLMQFFSIIIENGQECKSFSPFFDFFAFLQSYVDKFFHFPRQTRLTEPENHVIIKTVFVIM